MNLKAVSGIAMSDYTTNMSALPEWHRPEEAGRVLGSDHRRQNQWFCEKRNERTRPALLREDAVRAVEKAIVNGRGNTSCWRWRPIPVKPVPPSP